jgi:signal transduction histidine kinase
LTSLLMHIWSMQRALSEGRPTNLSDRLEKLARSGVRLEKLIEQLLDVSRITAGRLRLEPEPFDLVELIQEVVARFNDESARARTPVSVCGIDHLRGLWDRSRIDQVVTNLLSNAIKYGKGKPIEIEVRAADGVVLVRVTDHGIGIDPAQHARLFSRFERAVSAREYGGLGLGLWIVRQIIEASGGEIGVESASSSGSTFTFQLPLHLGEQVHASQ